jgi:hypothetical protein
VTPENRQQSLEKARQACKRLRGYEFSGEEKIKFQREVYPELGFFCYDLEELVDHLIAGFKLLDDKGQRKAGKK